MISRKELLYVAWFVLLCMGTVMYKTECRMARRSVSNWVNSTYTNGKQMLVELPGMLPDDFYKGLRGTQDCAIVFAEWLRYLATVSGNFVYHCCMVAFKIPMMYKRKTVVEIKTSRMLSNTVGINPCTQVVFWMNMENLVGIATVEDFVYQFLVTGIEVVCCFYVLYFPVCMILNQFGMRTRHSNCWIFAHFVFWVWLIGQHLQLWPALYDTYVRIKDPKTMGDWLVLKLKAKDVKCYDLLLGKVD